MAALLYTLAVDFLAPLAEGDILGQAAIEKEWVLRHIADTPRPARAQAVVQLLPVHQYPAAAGPVQTGQQTDYGAFACARGADKADHAALGDAQADVLQSVFMPLASIGIAEADMLEAYLLPQGAGALLRRGQGQSLNLLHFLEYGVYRGQLLLHDKQSLHHAVHDRQQTPSHSGQQGQRGAHVGQGGLLPAQQQYGAQQKTDAHEFQYPRGQGREDRQHALSLHIVLFCNAVLANKVFLLPANEDIADTIKARMNELHGSLLGISALLAVFAYPTAAAAKDSPGGYTGDADHQDSGQGGHAADGYQQGGHHQQLGQSL